MVFEIDQFFGLQLEDALTFMMDIVIGLFTAKIINVLLYMDILQLEVDS